MVYWVTGEQHIMILSFVVAEMHRRHDSYDNHVVKIFSFMRICTIITECHRTCHDIQNMKNHTISL